MRIARLASVVDQTAPSPTATWSARPSSTSGDGPRGRVDLGEPFDGAGPDATVTDADRRHARNEGIVGIPERDAPWTAPPRGRSARPPEATGRAPDPPIPVARSTTGDPIPIVFTTLCASRVYPRDRAVSGVAHPYRSPGRDGGRREPTGIEATTRFVAGSTTDQGRRDDRTGRRLVADDDSRGRSEATAKGNADDDAATGPRRHAATARRGVDDRRRHARRRRIELGVLLQDRPLEPLQLRSRLQPQLVGRAGGGRRDRRRGPRPGVRSGRARASAGPAAARAAGAPRRGSRARPPPRRAGPAAAAPRCVPRSSRGALVEAMDLPLCELGERELAERRARQSASASLERDGALRIVVEELRHPWAASASNRGASTAVVAGRGYPGDRVTSTPSGPENTRGVRRTPGGPSRPSGALAHRASTSTSVETTSPRRNASTARSALSRPVELQRLAGVVANLERAEDPELHLSSRLPSVPPAHGRALTRSLPSLTASWAPSPVRSIRSPPGRAGHRRRRDEGSPVRDHPRRRRIRLHRDRRRGGLHGLHACVAQALYERSEALDPCSTAWATMRSGGHSPPRARLAPGAQARSEAMNRFYGLGEYARQGAGTAA